MEEVINGLCNVGNLLQLSSMSSTFFLLQLFLSPKTLYQALHLEKVRKRLKNNLLKEECGIVRVNEHGRRVGGHRG